MSPARHDLRCRTNVAAALFLAWLAAAGCSEKRGQDSFRPDGVATKNKAPADEKSPAPFFLATPAIPPRFVNVAEQAGIRFRRFSDIVPDRFFLPEIMGGGAAWIDFDADGRLDLYLADGCSLWTPEPGQTRYVNRLYRNLGDGRFEDVSFLSGTADNRYGQGLAVGDFDADGFADLYVTNFGRNTLLRNNGDGTFDDVTDAAGVGDELWGTSTVWLDVDGDGLLDLYVVNYLNCSKAEHQICLYDGKRGYCGPGRWQARPDRVYRNQGDGRFVERARFLGLQAPGGKGLAVSVCDFDGDLKPEIYVANDMMPNFLYTRTRVNAGKTKQTTLYREVAEAAGCARSRDGANEASMGIACADFDGDGLVDVFLTHYYQQKSTLYRNLGGLSFEDDSRRTRIAVNSYQTIGFGTAAIDFDRDGFCDLFVANGHVLGPNYGITVLTPQLLKNDGAGRFDDVSKSVGGYFDIPVLGRGVAAGDYDNDGDVDLVVTHVDRPTALLRNDTVTGRNFIGFDLRTRNRIPPIGGRIIVTAGRVQRIVPVTAGGSYLSSGDSRIVVGLGAHRGKVSVAVHWPSGRVDRFPDLSPNVYWQILDRGNPRILPAAAR
jgi:FG-GAP-like repeat/ASPIC and UnbV